MKRPASLFAILLAAALPVLAEPASQATVERLLSVTRTPAMIDAAYASAQGVMRQSVRGAAGPNATPEQLARLDELAARSSAAMREEMSWEKLRPDFVRMYQDTFTEDELRAAIAFYESPAGQSMLSKMPGLMQRSMSVMQQRVQALMPRIRAEAEAAMRGSRDPQASQPAPAQSPQPMR